MLLILRSLRVHKKDTSSDSLTREKARSQWVVDSSISIRDCLSDATSPFHIRSFDKDTIFKAAQDCFQAILQVNSSVQELREQLVNIKKTLSPGSSCGLCGAIEEFSRRLQLQDLQTFTEADADAKVDRTIKCFSAAMRSQHLDASPATAAASTLVDRVGRDGQSIKELFGDDDLDNALFAVANNNKQPATSAQSQLTTNKLFCDDGLDNTQFADSLSHNRLFKPPQVEPSQVRKESAAKDGTSKSQKQEVQPLFTDPCALNAGQSLDQTKRNNDKFEGTPLEDGSAMPSGSVLPSLR